MPAGRVLRVTRHEHVASLIELIVSTAGTRNLLAGGDNIVSIVPASLANAVLSRGSGR